MPRGFSRSCSSPTRRNPQKGYRSRLLFFFSSRRRHTRFKCDWSSDVCSSDLFAVKVVEDQGQTIVTAKLDGTFDRTGLPDPFLMDHCFNISRGKIAALTIKLTRDRKASCRERV